MTPSTDRSTDPEEATVSVPAIILVIGTGTVITYAWIWAVYHFRRSCRRFRELQRRRDARRAAEEEWREAYLRATAARERDRERRVERAQEHARLLESDMVGEASNWDGQTLASLSPPDSAYDGTDESFGSYESMTDSSAGWSTPEDSARSYGTFTVQEHSRQWTREEGTEQEMFDNALQDDHDAWLSERTLNDETNEHVETPPTSQISSVLNQ